MGPIVVKKCKTVVAKIWRRIHDDPSSKRRIRKFRSKGMW